MDKEQRKKMRAALSSAHKALQARLRDYSEFCKDLPDLERLIGPTDAISRMLTALQELADSMGPVPEAAKVQAMLSELEKKKAVQQRIGPLTRGIEALGQAIDRMDA